MKKIILSIIIIVCAISIVSAGDLLPTRAERPEQWNGHEWNNMTYEQKAYYSAGMLAMGNILLEQFGATPDELIKTESIQKEIAKIDEFYKNNDLAIPITQSGQ